jgi:hypothetical protein
MMIIWCVVALAGLGGLYCAIRARAVTGRKHPEVSSEVSAELIRRADQQNRWTMRGDTRGVYGAKGAELMRSVSPEPNVDTKLDKATAYPQTAVIASTPEDLAALLAEKLPCWRWAAFVSVLVQRRAELESRLYTTRSSTSLWSVLAHTRTAALRTRHSRIRSGAATHGSRRRAA